MKTLPLFKRSLIFLLLIGLVHISQGQSVVDPPASHFGFQPGTDRMLFDYEQLMEYLKEVEQVSPRVHLEQIGTSPMGQPMYIAFFSSPENIDNLDNLRDINRELALNPNLSEQQRAEYFREGKVFFTATLSMHASEVGPSQAAPLIAYRLATTENPDTLQWLDDVVYMMVPSHNPDGMNMVVEHYRKYKGTKYEGSSMPGVYHKYVGHDNNRDFVTLTQSDNRAISRIFSHTWFPQVMAEKHQMGSTGPRYFVPPNHDPIAENIDAGIWNWIGLFGMNMIKDMTREGLAGVSQHYAFDNYWPGSTETCIWKNVIGFLTECASVRYAKPIYVEENELSVWGKGLAEYKKSINMPEPWEGGWWRLRDILDYEVVSTFSAIKSCANHRRDILAFRNDMCRTQVEKGKTQPPYYYIFPREQHDPGEFVDLINLLNDHGVQRFVLEKSIHLEGRRFSKGDVVVPLAQPFRPFIKEVLEEQDYPVRHYTPDGEIIKPYDITSWSLPLHKGVTCYETDHRSQALENSLSRIEGAYDLKGPAAEDYQALVFPFTRNESYRAAFMAEKKGLDAAYTLEDFQLNDQTMLEGAFVIPFSSGRKEEISQIMSAMKVQPFTIREEHGLELKELEMPQIALVETYLHDMDAGWTRYIFDRYQIAYDILRPAQINQEALEDYDVLVFPDSHKSVLMQGSYESDRYYRMSSYPPEYTEGMGQQGLKDLMAFVDEGGKVVSWGSSAELFMGKQVIEKGDDQEETFKLPVSNQADEISQSGFYCPGSLVQVHLSKNTPLTMGMPATAGVFYRGDPVFQTSVPIFDMNRRVLAHFSEEDILMSGYAEEEEQIAGLPAQVWVSKGAGEMILFSFQPQFRASTTANYKLIFNSLLFSSEP
ncbi:MAG: hypothetical protein KGY60_08865 [Bacteroidales bacterium]|nr:hypothetical protein [Bacteroidales bacterium]